MLNGTVYPRWIDGEESFWYERETDAGTEIRVVDAATGDNRLLFGYENIAAALEKKIARAVDSKLLLLKNLRVEKDGTARFEAFGKPFVYDDRSRSLEEPGTALHVDWLISPDNKLAVRVRDHNLWLKDLMVGSERALTTDGIETHAYASPPLSGRFMQAVFGQRVSGIWSPDSRHVLTLQSDDREVPELPVMAFVPREGVRPNVSPNHTSFPGDPKVTEFRIVAIDVLKGRQIEAAYPRLTAVRMNDTPFEAGLAWWSADARTAYFVHIERGERAAHVVAFDIELGTTRVVFSETANTYLELGVNVYEPALVFPLPATNEFIWYSERSGRGHLYLYDLENGALKRTITHGAWQIRDVQHVDAKRREIFFAAAGIASEEGPYTCKPCIASLDEDVLRIVSTEPGEHVVWRPRNFALFVRSMTGRDCRDAAGVAPSGNYFVETIAGVDRLPVTVLKRRSGESVATLESPDGRMLPSEWRWPEAVTLTAADGKTDIHGLLFQPASVDPTKSYPVIDFVYGGPQIAFVPRAPFCDFFSTTHYLEAASLAALGAFVLMIDGRGTAYRERAFREASYGAIQNASNLEDHIAGIRQLVDYYPSMDLERVGITGMSGGGYLAAMGGLRFGDFYKVAVAASGNYDQALFWHCWGERYQGIFEPELYKAQAAKTYASGLNAKILFIHGLLDAGCHPAALFQLLQALIDENKDMDLVLMPQAGHEMTGYAMRRRLDYFVAHLFGSVPPPPTQFTTSLDAVKTRMAFNADIASTL